MPGTTDAGPRVEALIVTPLAFSDPPLLNAGGVHEPLVVRCLVELVVSGGGRQVIGLGECAGHAFQLDYLELLAERLPGLSVFDRAGLRRLVQNLLSTPGEDVDLSPGASWRKWADRGCADSRGPAPMPAKEFDVQRVFSALEVALLDAQGKVLGVRAVDLLGGAVREQVPYAGYLFYKWAEHPALDGRPAIGDEWGPALDPDGIVEQARRFVDLFGFRSLKLKGGVMPAEQEVAAIRALRRAFPEMPLRLDPNAVWDLATTLRVLPELEELLEYLEDPVAGLDEMAAVARATRLPLATNMVVTSEQTILPAAAQGAISILLGDHHYWGGLQGSVELGAVARVLGWPLSMHSNSHLGISLAAMTTAAAATAEVTHACDTHYPWGRQDDIVTEPATFVDGSVAVLPGPGLGVTLDRSTVNRLHQQYLDAGREHRNDGAYLKRATQ